MSDTLDLDAPLEGIDIATGHALCRDLHGGPCVCQKTGQVRCLKVTRAINGQQSDLREIQAHVENLMQPEEAEKPVADHEVRLSLWQRLVRRGQLADWDSDKGEILRQTREIHEKLWEMGADKEAARAKRCIDGLEAERREIERWGRASESVATSGFTWPSWSALSLRLSVWCTVVQSHFYLRDARRQYKELAERGMDSPELRATLDRAEASQQNAIRLAKGRKA